MIIIDTGTSNAFSVQRALRHLGYEIQATTSNATIKAAQGIILPGVGSFDATMNTLSKNYMISALEQAVQKNKTPILGICVGMQILFEGSDEGISSGLGFLPGRLTKLSYCHDSPNKVPNTGFKNVNLDPNNALNIGLGVESFFYFNHSFALPSLTDFEAKDTASHEFEFIASFQHGNIFGVQYHPEKSQLAGLKILKNFMEICKRQ